MKVELRKSTLGGMYGVYVGERCIGDVVLREDGERLCYEICVRGQRAEGWTTSLDHVRRAVELTVEAAA